MIGKNLAYQFDISLYKGLKSMTRRIPGEQAVNVVKN